MSTQFAAPLALSPQHIYQSRTSLPLMASASPRDHLNPMSPADHIAPTRESATRTYNTNSNNTQQHISVHSHMMRPLISHYAHMTRPVLHLSRLGLNPGIPDYTPNPVLASEDNTQPRFELFLLGEGEKKVTEEADTREFSFSSSSSVANTRCILHQLLDHEKRP